MYYLYHFYNKGDIKFSFENVNNFLLMFAKSKKKWVLGSLFLLPLLTPDLPEISDFHLKGTSIFPILGIVDVANQGGEFRFFRDVQMKKC